ncbi:MAG: tetraacyldisaccharide 4'-kinase [Zoogloeaceae bacterium]|jgi:tetraacyldisaccharide 4'-kinase|nr:tetraacyldisaccharide 4'-kinase [Zoogloeaceae bacterium]
MAWIQKRWYVRSLSLPAWCALFPLIFPSLVFAGLSAARRLAYRRGWLRARALPVPVVVVGNLTVGGTGKTPLVLALIERLRAAGWRPGVISRGYGGRAVAPIPALPDARPDEVGDEPILLATRGNCPVWVGQDRIATAWALLAAHPEIDLLLSDDGLQHYRLRRDIELVVFDGRGIGNGWLLPLGPLREPLQRIRRVTALVTHGAPDPRVLAAASGIPCHTMTLEPGPFYRLGAPAQRAAVPELLRDCAGRPLHAIAGIGHPDRFFRTLSALGLVFTAHPFPDHHAFTEADLDFAPDAVLLMTEKDGVKCTRLNLGEAWVLPVSAHLDPGLTETLLETLHGRKTA